MAHTNAWVVLKADVIAELPSERDFAEPWTIVGVGYATYIKAIAGRLITVEAARLIEHWVKRKKALKERVA